MRLDVPLGPTGDELGDADRTHKAQGREHQQGRDERVVAVERGVSTQSGDGRGQQHVHGQGSIQYGRSEQQPNGTEQSGPPEQDGDDEPQDGHTGSFRSAARAAFRSATFFPVPRARTIRSSSMKMPSLASSTLALSLAPRKCTNRTCSSGATSMTTLPGITVVAMAVKASIRSESVGKDILITELLTVSRRKICIETWMPARIICQEMWETIHTVCSGRSRKPGVIGGIGNITMIVIDTRKPRKNRPRDSCR